MQLELNLYGNPIGRSACAPVKESENFITPKICEIFCYMSNLLMVHILCKCVFFYRLSTLYVHTCDKN